MPDLPTIPAAMLQAQLEAAGLSARHELRVVAADDLMDTLEPYRDLLTTMGRTLEAEQAFFLAACAAARLALDPAAGRRWAE